MMGISRNESGTCRVIAILPAAGSGERTGLRTPKQFCEIAGYPLILHTLWSFQSSWIGETVIAVSEDWLSYLQDLVHHHCLHNITLVVGGDTRHRSIRKCVQYVKEKVQRANYDERDVVVIVHDAVRPFVAEETLKAVAEAAHEHGAAGVVCPLVSTTLATRPEGLLDYSLVRSKHCNSHTPQAFLYQTIVTAYDKISEHDLEHGTEVLHLALEYAGVRARLLETKDEVWKVTYRRDVCAAEQFARERLARVGILADKAENDKDIVDALEEQVKANRMILSQKCTSFADLSSNVNALILIKHVAPQHQSMCDLTAALGKLRQEIGPLRGSITLLVTMTAEQREVRDDMMTRIQELAADEKYKDICVYCVIMEKKGLLLERDKLEKACKLVASLVLKQDELLTGQTFIT